ncbi:hypothetical protein VTO42DRAFT_4214 [Malbranchea cinnamomea]
MGREDQAEERETLKSIFPDEITDISDTTYRISITLDVTGNEDDYPEPPVIILQVTYPEDYPDVAPNLEIIAPSNAPKYPHLHIQEDRDRLLESLQSTIEENLGMVMIFTLVDALKEGAQLLISERQKAAEALREFEAAKSEEEENRKFQGTPVTRETFLEWRERFRQELAEEARRQQEEKELEEKKNKKVVPPKEAKRLTGKQLWERGLAGKGDYDEDEGALPAKVEKISLAT